MAQQFEILDREDIFSMRIFLTSLLRGRLVVFSSISTSPCDLIGATKCNERSISIEMHKYYALASAMIGTNVPHAGQSKKSELCSRSHF